jgi:hypothetical protein
MAVKVARSFLADASSALSCLGVVSMAVAFRGGGVIGVRFKDRYAIRVLVIARR